jgi:hypothetical protein
LSAIARLKTALETKVPCEEISVYISAGPDVCPECGAKLFYVTDGVSLKVEGPPCPCPEGLTETKFTLNVPSGKLVAANDLRQWFPITDDWNINYKFGTKKTIEAYAEVGMAHGFVGNSCPSIYRMSDSTINIVSVYEKDEDEENYNDKIISEPVDDHLTTQYGTKVGGICTDLWWYSVVDFDDFKDRWKKFKGNDKDFEEFLADSCDVIDVSPGLYEVIHNMSYNDYGDDHCYASMSRIGPPLPVRDYVGEWLSQNRTAGQVFCAAMLDYPTLYLGMSHLSETYKQFSSYSKKEKIAYIQSLPNDKYEQCLQRVADHYFCVCGGGVEWHPNGWCYSGRVDADLPDLPIPKFSKQYYWYPFSKSYAALCLALDDDNREEIPRLNDSFVSVIFNALECIVRYGMLERATHRNVEKQVELAKESLIGLDKMYPDKTPESCKELLWQ